MKHNYAFNFKFLRRNISVDSGKLIEDSTLVSIETVKRSLTIAKNFGGIKILRPRLTKYCWGCVSGIPGSIAAYGVMSWGPRSVPWWCPEGEAEGLSNILD